MHAGFLNAFMGVDEVEDLLDPFFCFFFNFPNKFKTFMAFITFMTVGDGDDPWLLGLDAFGDFDAVGDPTLEADFMGVFSGEKTEHWPCASAAVSWV